MPKGLGSSKVPASAGGTPGTSRAEPTRVGALNGATPEDWKEQETSDGVPLFVAESGEVERIGHYEVTGYLGRGGMGVVYEAVDQTSGSVYAIKTIETRFLELPESNAEQRFKQEISVLERLNHRGIVRLYDSGFARHPMGYALAFFVMERLEGGTLEPDIKSNKIFPLDDSLGIILQLADAIEYLNANGVLHRDIKPGNIFREVGGRVVLMDFGLARSEEFTRLTLAGQIVGTFGYMSPERLTGKALDVSSDVFALGIVLFQMLAGGHPYGGASPTEMLDSIKRGLTMPPNIMSLPHAEDVKALILGMLAYTRDARPTPAQLRTTIVDLLGKIEEASPTKGRTSNADKRIFERRASPTKTAGPRVPQATPAAPTPLEPTKADTVTPIVERQGDGLVGISTKKNEPKTPTQPASSPQQQPLVGSLNLGAISTPGPSWATTGLLTTAAACVAFLAGLLVGRSQQPDVILPVASPPAAQATNTTAPLAEPRSRATPLVTPRATESDETMIDASSLKNADEAFRRGEHFLVLERHRDAVPLLARALELNPAYADAHKLLGDAYAGLGDPERAAHHYKTYLALRPTADDASEVRRLLKTLAP